MLYNVAQLLREPTGAERTYALDERLPAEAEGLPVSHVTGSLRLVRTHRGLLAYADLHGTAHAECARCLGTAEIPIDTTLEDEFLPTVDVNTGAPLPPVADPDVFQIDDHHHIDLTEAVRQALLVEQPMAPLCRPDCAGLCPECGADLNAGPHICADTPTDSRWAALRALAAETDGDTPAPAATRNGRASHDRPAGAPAPTD